ncbi:MAG: hypothetical protein EB072_17490, partial [Betaproteobacteria bacterium]|nr:hypothetical protein [Betaproteobacteria bacterium]
MSVSTRSPGRSVRIGGINPGDMLWLPDFNRFGGSSSSPGGLKALEITAGGSLSVIGGNTSSAPLIVHDFTSLNGQSATLSGNIRLSGRGLVADGESTLTSSATFLEPESITPSPPSVPPVRPLLGLGVGGGFAGGSMTISNTIAGDLHVFLTAGPSGSIAVSSGSSIGSAAAPLRSAAILAGTLNGASASSIFTRSGGSTPASSLATGTFTFSGSATSSATTNTEDVPLPLLAGSTLTVGTCGEIGSGICNVAPSSGGLGGLGGISDGDSFLRLQTLSGNTLSQNNDSGGLILGSVGTPTGTSSGAASLISFSPTVSESGQWSRLRAGCFDAMSCHGLVAFAIKIDDGAKLVALTPPPPPPTP